MKTLIEKWNFYNSEINKREKSFVEQNVPNPPKALYEVFRNGNLRELVIENVLYYNGKNFRLEEGRKRPSSLQVETIKNYYENENSLSLDNIMFAYRWFFGENSSASGWIKYCDLHKYLNKEDAKAKSKELSEINEKEQELITKGTHLRCERCSKITEKDKIVNKHLVSIYTYGHKGRDGKFCSSKCASEEQMSLEG